MKSTLRLFNGLLIKTKDKKEPSKELLQETVKRGFVFSPEVITNYSNYEELIKLVESEKGLTPEKLNSSFHKSWEKIREASIEQLVLEQIVHYFTTYGFEAFGIYDENSVYIPTEKLEIPKIDIDKIPLTIIRGYTKEELKSKLLELLTSGIALSEDTIKDAVDVALLVKLNEKEIAIITNKEVNSIFYDCLNIIPENPIEFLRFCIYKSIGKTLLIKDKETFEAIKEKPNTSIAFLLSKYEATYGLIKLAEIFYRFKPIFLAFRTNSQLKKTINKIRRMARKYHQPMPENYINNITTKIKRGETIDKDILVGELDKVNTFRKIRLAYALKFRTISSDSILYRIRNGKGWAEEFNFDKQNSAKIALDIVMDSIVKDISQIIKGKKIYIPENIVYALPTTEKQFTGAFPSGTYVKIPKDMIVGIHWENTNHHRIDLDLSIVKEDQKYGWDADYRNKARSILFSGDMTNAPKPKGASELFYVKKQSDESFLLFVNYYNYELDVEVPMDIFVAQEEVTGNINHYIVDPNKIVAVAKSKIIQQQKLIGLLIAKPKECKFYFAESYLGRSISSSDSKFAEHSRKYLFNFYKDTINFNDILIKANAEMSIKEKCDIDLSPENLEKDSIIKLIKK